MTIHFHRALDNLKNRLLLLSARVEDNLRRAVDALERKDADLARRVIEADDEIDQMEVEVEEECLEALALHQPVAVDLRLVVSALKINNDLERVGDLAVNIAERAEYLATQDLTDIAFDFHAMAEKTQWMLRKSLDAFVNTDPALAREVCRADDDVDAMNRRMYHIVEEAVQTNPKQAQKLMHLLSVARHMERIADLATNISEDVIYMAEGEIVRHRVERYIPPDPN